MELIGTLGRAIEWDHPRLPRTSNGGVANRRPQIEHIVLSRQAAWSPLWWRPWFYISRFQYDMPSILLERKGFDSPIQVCRQRPAHTFKEQYSQDKWFEDNLCGKTDGFAFRNTASLVMAEYACASQIFTSFTDVPSLAWVDSRYMSWSTSSSASPFIHIPYVGR